MLARAGVSLTPPTRIDLTLHRVEGHAFADTSCRSLHWKKLRARRVSRPLRRFAKNCVRRSFFAQNAHRPTLLDGGLCDRLPSGKPIVNRFSDVTIGRGPKKASRKGRGPLARQGCAAFPIMPFLATMSQTVVEDRSPWSPCPTVSVSF